MIRSRSIVLAFCVLGMSACGSADREKQQALQNPVESNGTIAASLSEHRELSTLASAMTETQLAPVLDGKADYTVLAPDNDAFAALGGKTDDLMRKDNHPLLIAVLRAHILPGQVTPEAITEAIRRKKGPVEMATMSGGTVTFARGADGLTVSNEGTTASLSPRTTTASNGAILPIDKVLLPPS